MTRGDVLRYRLAFALIRAAKVVRGLRQALSEADRFAVADDVVNQLKERGDPWRLSEEAEPRNGMPTTRPAMSADIPRHQAAGPSAPSLEPTDEMIAAAVPFLQDQCEIQSEAAAASIARGLWDRMIGSAPSEYFRTCKRPSEAD